MTARERVLTACRFESPDRIPHYDNFWRISETFQQAFNHPEDLTDLKIWVPLEGTFPTRMKILKQQGHETVRINEWGVTIREVKGADMYETLDVPIPPGTDIDAVQFDPPDLNLRYQRNFRTPEDATAQLERDRQKACVFGKTGGPYLRTAFVRGTEQFLMDIAGDPPLARALADKMGVHLAAVGVEQLRRWNLHDTGIWIFDDMASNKGPMFSPQAFERILLPAYRHMIQSYKSAGARYVFLHSDGDVRLLLDMLIDAGIDGLHPLEPRAGMNVFDLRKRYPKTVLVGGMDNTDTFIHGPIERIEREARAIIDLGRDGGIIIGTHSISPDTPLEHVQAYLNTCRTYGNFTTN